MQNRPLVRQEGDSPDAGLFISIPVLNEIGNIGALIAEIETVLGEGENYTLLFTDDGSTDGTVEFLERLLPSEPRVRLLQREKTRHGCQRGGALYAAMLWGLANTAHSIFVEMDGDMSHRPEEIPLGLAELERSGADFVIASKYMPGAKTIRRPFSRRAVSALCNFAVRSLISREVTDYSNGFRFYTRSVAEMLSKHAFRYTSPIYLSEALATCLRNGCGISEFPSVYVGRSEGLSKLRPIDLLKASLAVFDISFRYHGPGFGTATTSQAKALT
jgi:dolichol-phosphate mannosyltransferase